MFSKKKNKKQDQFGGWREEDEHSTDLLKPDAYNSTGTVPWEQPMPVQELTDVTVEALWEKMYKHAMAVIVVCEACATPQAISNGTCMQCGYPLPKPKKLGR